MPSLELVEEIAVSTYAVYLKFGYSIKVSSIENERFVVENQATSETLADPFQPILLEDHYNSVSRVLELYWNDSVLEPNTEYHLTITGLKDLHNNTLDDVIVSFTTGDDVTTEPGDEDTPPDTDEFDIEDHSILNATWVATTTDDNDSSSDTFEVDATDPENGDYYLPSNYNNGRVSIAFTQTPHGDYITAAYFKVQRRLMSRYPTRWETVDVQLSVDPDDDTIIYVDFPSTDATPVFNDEDGEYFEENYKYRIIVADSLPTDAATATTLGGSHTVLFAGVIDPLYVNPDELTAIFPDALPVEIAEQIFFVSLEVKDMLSIADDNYPSWIALDYIKAAAACSLSKIYDTEDGEEQTVRLGDFTVTNRSFPKRIVNRGTANTWCELAAALRTELLRSSTGLRGVIEGDKLINPIPVRKLKRVERYQGHCINYRSSRDVIGEY